MSQVNVQSSPTSRVPPISTDRVEQIAARLRGFSLFEEDIVTQPHPLLAMVTRDERSVVVVPAAIWVRARDMLRGFARKIAEGHAVLVMVGRPPSLDVNEAIDRSIASIAGGDLETDDEHHELALAVHRAFELMDARARAETRGKWLRR